jgi:hypothetical protein
MSLYPNVPDLPGVPPIARNILAPVAVIASPIVSRFLSLFDQTWGVFDEDNNQVLAPDSFLGIEFQNAFNISNYPVEQGAFASYNKVNNPFACWVRVAKGGSKEDRDDFLEALGTLSKSLDLYTIVTPEKVYSDVNLETFDYRRETDNGAGIIVANCKFIEIRQATAEYSNTKSPTASDTYELGTVQPT